MPRFRTGRVDSISTTREGIQHITVDTEPAYVLTDVIGTVQVGDAVVINTTAVDLSLGTGGLHVVHWNLARSRIDAPVAGHIMKARYLSEQLEVDAWEEHDAQPPHRLADPLPSLDGLTVVTCMLHSHVGAIATAIGAVDRAASVAFVMTDWASLPLALSNLVVELTKRGLIDLTVTTGHAFGGDVEAVTVASGLLAAKNRGADIVIVGPGPGHAGTGTALGFSSLEAVGATDMAGALGARVTLTPRWSGRDERERHRGLSHHTATMLGLLARPIAIAVPDGAIADAVTRVIEAGSVARAEVVSEPVDVRAAFSEFDLSVRSMGRDLAADPDALAALGAVAAWCTQDRR